MTNQDVIAEGLFNILFNAYGSTAVDQHPNVLSYRILDFLHKQGVMIKTGHVIMHDDGTQYSITEPLIKV